MIEYVIFDLDDTLCDYRKAKQNAVLRVGSVLERLGLDVARFWHRYNETEPRLFKQFVKGIISKEEYRLHRYADILQSESQRPLEVAVELNSLYLKAANGGITFL